MKAARTEVPEGLVFEGPWGLGEEGFSAVAHDLAALAPKTLVEFGSGISTARFAVQFPKTTIRSFDHLPGYTVKTRRLLWKYELDDIAHVEYRPLKWQYHHGLFYHSYAPGQLPSTVDAVLIDGPPSSIPFGREACLHQVADVLRIGGRVYLDDFERSFEKRILANWLHIYGDIFQLHTLRSGHQICVLTKVKPVSASFSAAVFCDHTVARLTGLGGRIHSRLKCLTTE